MNKKEASVKLDQSVAEAQASLDEAKSAYGKAVLKGQKMSSLARLRNAWDVRKRQLAEAKAVEAQREAHTEYERQKANEKAARAAREKTVEISNEVSALAEMIASDAKTWAMPSGSCGPTWISSTRSARMHRAGRLRWNRTL